MPSTLNDPNGDRAFVYEFDLQFRHYRMGYGRSVSVLRARSAEEAIEIGRRRFNGLGSDFDLISLKRGRIVERIA